EWRHPYSAANANFGIGCVYAAQGKLEDAIASLDVAVGVCRRAEIPALFPFPASLLGYAYALAGASAEGSRLASEAVEKAAALRLNCHQAPRMAHRAGAYLLSGDLGHARVHGDQALHLSQSHEERGNEASCQRVLGRISAMHDPADVASAREHYRTAIALASELGMRPLVAHCHRDLGELHRRTDPLEARKHLTTAATMYREMEMPFWLDKAK